MRAPTRVNAPGVSFLGEEKKPPPLVDPQGLEGGEVEQDLPQGYAPASEHANKGRLFSRITNRL